MVSNYFDDLSNSRNLPELLDAARSSKVIELGQLREIAYGAADPKYVAQHGEYWLRTLLDFLERAGIGELARDSETGELVFLPASQLPSIDEAWDRVVASSREEAG